MAATFKMKQGDTFAFYANIKDLDGVEVTGAANRIKSQVVTGDDISVGEFIISESEVPGKYLFKITDTSAFPADDVVYTDIQYTENDIVVSSVTMTISVIKDVTK